MRKWHRWLSVFFAVFMLWIAVTGVLSQVVPLFNSPPRQHQASSFVCPADYVCRPKASGNSIVGLLHHLHSGETFGPLGVVISTLSGFALIFFSVSGLWLYIQMWRNRKNRSLTPRWFWK
jgi:hypothetical protein